VPLGSSPAEDGLSLGVLLPLSPEDAWLTDRRQATTCVEGRPQRARSTWTGEGGGGNIPIGWGEGKGEGDVGLKGRGGQRRWGAPAAAGGLDRPDVDGRGSSGALTALPGVFPSAPSNGGQ